MELYEKLQPEFVHADERGKLIQMVHCGYQQMNLLETRQGVIRGGHYHKAAKEAFFVISGSVEVILERDGSSCSQIFKKDDFFLIPPNTIHEMYFPEDCVMVALYDTPIEMADGTKDIYKGED